MRTKKLLVTGILMFFVLGLGAFFNHFVPTQPVSFHTEKEHLQLLHTLNADSGQYFLTSYHCKTCHGYDSLHYSNIDHNGNSVNVFDDWESSMMANSAKDPFWRAKVSHEILIDPSNALQLQDKCTSCHAPMGHYTSKFHGNAYYTITDLENDSLGLNGVACTACHTIGNNGLGEMFSGDIPYDTTRKIFGPYTNPNVGPMQLYVNYTPTYSAHMSEGKICSTCHTLITDAVDLSGVPTGKKFIEQATFHEWKNSAAFSDNVTCQNCHMPRVADSIIIANQYFNLPPRAPFNRHKFMGANEFMIKLIKQNKDSLGIEVKDVHFDSTIARTTKFLQEQTLSVKLFLDSISNDSAFIKLRLTNKAGHKFPSGYPSRRVTVQLLAIDDNNDTIFKSGMFNPDYSLMHNSNGYQPHYDIICNDSLTQTYEMVMGDVNANRTTILERADTILKDNRIPPEGFETGIPLYDTIKIYGAAEMDDNFNKYVGGIDGSGQDYVFYHISLNGLSANFSIYTNVFYQAVPPEWLEEMFSMSSGPIDKFKNMYNQSDRSPVLVGNDSLVNLAVGMIIPQNREYSFIAMPSVTSDGWVKLKGKDMKSVELIHIHNMAGQLLRMIKPENAEEEYTIKLPDTPGLYIVSLYIENKRVSLKVLRQ